MTTRPRKTTHPRVATETVAEPQEETREDQTVAAPSDVVEEPTASVEPQPEAPDDVTRADASDEEQPVIAENRPGKGMCDNHPDREAVLVTDFPWASPQRFCNLCVPPQYRYLLP